MPHGVWGGGSLSNFLEPSDHRSFLKSLVGIGTGAPTFGYLKGAQQTGPDSESMNNLPRCLTAADRAHFARTSRVPECELSFYKVFCLQMCLSLKRSYEKWALVSDF